MSTEPNEHQKAAEAHAKKRAASRAKKSATKAPKAKAKPSKLKRVKELPLENAPNIEGSREQRLEVKLQLEADTKAALDHTAEPTSLFQERLAYSEAKKAALEARRSQRKDRYKRD
jgi:hypothetical protein